jgi:hypothetical protein
MELLVVFSGLVLLALTALRRGVDTTDSVDSPEWQRRRQWAGFGSRN